MVFGLPLGEFAMGGKYKVMPPRMRVVCAISVVIQIAAIIALLQTGNIIDTGIPAGITKAACYVIAVYLSINVVMNALSNSKKERYVVTPLSLVAAVCFWITAING